MADQEAQAVRDRRPLTLTLIVVSGAPGTGKSTIAGALGAALRFPVLTLDPVKEALADVLGLGDEDWSNRLGDAAAEVVFRLASERAAARIGHGRHPIHRDVINPAMADLVGLLAASVTPLRLGAALVEVDTGTPGAGARAVAAIRAVLG